MTTVLMWLMVFGFTLCCLFLIFVVLIQSGKGGGLGGGAFGGGSAISDSLGASGADKQLGRWTVYAAIAFALLSLGMTLLASRQTQMSVFDTLDEVPAATAPAAAPAALPEELPSAPGDAASPAEGGAIAPIEVEAAAPAPAEAPPVAPATEGESAPDAEPPVTTE